MSGFDEYTLGFLDDAGCRKLFYTYYKGPADEESLGLILERCYLHTLTVELLARTAQNAAISIAELYKKLATIIKQFSRLSDTQLLRHYKLDKDSRNWRVAAAQADIISTGTRNRPGQNKAHILG